MTDDDVEAVAQAIMSDRPRTPKEIATTTLGALKARGWQQVPDGYVVLPAEATDAILEAMADATTEGIVGNRDGRHDLSATDIAVNSYRAMIDAAQEDQDP